MARRGPSGSLGARSFAAGSTAPRSMGERTVARLGYRAGYDGRTLVTRVGKLELRVPQDREGRFSTELLERYRRSERARVAALAEMSVQGVSTRTVKAITEELCGHRFSASSISAINRRLDASLAELAGRRREEAYPYLSIALRVSRSASPASSASAATVARCRAPAGRPAALPEVPRSQRPRPSRACFRRVVSGMT